MSVENLPDPILITQPAELKQLAETLSREKILAVDTESNSLYAYREQVCLIQFSTATQDFLLDPLALKDLTPLAPLFRDPNLEKVFHAAEYDLICLKRDFGFEFNNLFDTMIAARVLGREAFGLGAILEEEFNIHLDKRFQRADWGQRPLPPELLAYARLDTRYLLPLRDRLMQDLERLELMGLAQEDFARITHVNGHAHEEKTDDCWRISGSFDVTPQQAAILQELCSYRDKVARSLNRPLFKVINDRTLLAIAINAPGNFQELSRIEGMSRGQIERHGHQLLSAVDRGLAARPVYPPRSPRPDDRFLERVEQLRRWRKQTAIEMGVKSDVVLPRDLMFELAERNPRQPEDLQDVMKDAPWRMQRFGSQILNLLTSL